MVMALVSITHSITSLPEEFRTAMEIASCVQPSRYASRYRFEPYTQNLLQRGAVLYRVGASLFFRLHFPCFETSDGFSRLEGISQVHSHDYKNHGVSLG